MIKIFYLAAAVIIALAGTARIVYAQSLEPRAYSNAPTGLNFVLAGFQNSSGALLFDPSLPITDADAKVDLALFGYARTLDVAGKLAKIGVIIPVYSAPVIPMVRVTLHSISPTIFMVLRLCP
jgi:hypothetical protein